MSHKRSLKREINASDTTSDDHPTSWKSLQPKRSRTEDYSEQTKTQDDSSAVRRSSRAPKPKVFDDDYTDTGVRSPGSEHETLKNKEPRSFSRNQGERKSVDDEEFAKRRSSRIPKPKLFDKEYLETAKSRGIEDKEEKNMAFATEVRVSQDWQKESSFHKGSTKCKKTTSVSKQGKADATASTAGGLQPQPAMKGNEGPRAWETPKVRTSLRTPMPKKTFALIDDSPVSRTGEGGEGLFEGDLYVDIITQESYATKHSKKMIIGQSDLDIVGTSPISSKKNWTSKNAGSHAGKHKKLKKLNTVVDSSTVPKDISEAEAPKKSVTIKKQSEAKEKKKEVSPKATSKTSGKFLRKSTTKNKPTDVSEDVVDVVGIQQMEVKKKSKKKKAEVEQSGFPSVSHEMIKTMSTGSEHGKNGSKHSKLKHKDEPHSEVKDKGHHIILKVHLPHGEPYNHSHHSHSHKKHKHKHSSETKNESGSSESKLKKAKSSHESDASTAPDKQRKKISIKFKGLSSPTPGVEFQGTENTAETEKKNKEMERVPKKKKPTNSSLDKPPTASGSHEKEHVKVVIKKNKKDLKVITNEGQKPSKTLSKSTCKDVKEKTKEDHGKGETPIKTTPKKKMKTSESPKSSEKEKRKIVTGYLLFCKKERSRIHEAHPRLEFAQISQKVGEAWKSLPESVKQEWKAKADHVKKNLTPTTKEDKKTESTKPGPDAVDMAAHLKLLGESLSVIGGSLMAQKETEVHGSLSVLLDSILCAICPLTFLTSHIPGIPGISKETQMEILDDLAYTMPGLG